MEATLCRGNPMAGNPMAGEIDAGNPMAGNPMAVEIEAGNPMSVGIENLILNYGLKIKWRMTITEVYRNA
jgi:hypothetical protein